MKRVFYILFSLLIFYNISNAQFISGTVTTESGSKLEETTVTLQGTDIGTVTDAKGYYKIKIDSLYGTLIFSRIGYDPQKINISTDSVANVVLKHSLVLPEFIVKAYITPPPRIIVYGSRVEKRKCWIFGKKTIKITETCKSPEQKIGSEQKIVMIEKFWENNGNGININRHAFFKYLYDNITYPEESVLRGIQGKIIVSFMLDIDNYVKDIAILKTLDKSIDNEVLLKFQSAQDYPIIFQSMSCFPETTDYKPKPKQTYFILPIIFRLEIVKE